MKNGSNRMEDAFSLHFFHELVIRKNLESTPFIGPLRHEKTDLFHPFSVLVCLVLGAAGTAAGLQSGTG